MKVRELIELLQRCPQDDTILAECDQFDEEADVKDVLVGSGTIRGFCFLSLDSDEWWKEIETLKAENAELKKLLRLAVQGFKYIDKYFGCAGCKENWQNCPYNAGKIDVCTERWKYADEAEKVLGGNEDA